MPTIIDNINYMKQFATLVPSEEFLQQGAAKINWRSIVFLINQTKDTDEFLWYANQCIEQGWSSNVLRHQIESGLYNRQVLVEKTTNFRTQLANPLGELAEGIAAARARGVKLGRPPKPLPDNFNEVYQKWKAEKISTEEAARLVNMPPSTFRYRANSYKKATL